ncbi:MAG TPA: M28 family peptidase [Terriglobales bacterium]|nr:M28 family peptidase [Terriglobales bacterium]
MIRWNRALIVALLAAAACMAQPAASQQSVTDASLPPSAKAAMKAIDPQHIRAHVRFLSSDLLEGRGTGQRGGDLAAEYIASQFESYGLQPAGDGGTFLQKVPMVGVTTKPESRVSFVQTGGKAMDLRLYDDIVFNDQSQSATDTIDAPVVFVGYGIKAPEYKWDDYKGANLAGKVLLMLVNEPPSEDANFFKSKALTYYGRWTYKYEEAARQGAVAAILIHKTEMASYGWDVVRSSWGGETSYLKSAGPKLKLAGWIQLAIAQQLASAAGKDLDTLMKDAQSRDFKPVELPFTVKANIASAVRSFESQNVVAMLSGSDAELKREAVAYSAHYDHLGIHPDQPGDNIYNGAVDNATGCGVLLELARVYSGAAERPRRSVLFSAVTAEEQGLLGSDYLAKHLPIPASQVSLDLNLDALAPMGIPQEVEVSGAERTTFYPVVESTARDFHLEIAPDSNPGAGHYYRSDHFSFARVGIPSFSMNEGMKFEGHPREWAMQQAKDFNAKHYHQPSDQFNPAWDFRGVADMARFGFDLGWKAASQSAEIGWQKGDEFEPARKSGGSK